MFSAVLIGDEAVAADFLKVGVTIGGRVAGLVAFYGMIYETRVKAAASGRPGPRVITGDYRRSIHSEFFQLPTGPAAVVSTNAPMARRLEYGYLNMTDSLGRTFQQVPRPHWEPPLAKTAKEFEDALAAAIAEAVA